MELKEILNFVIKTARALPFELLLLAILFGQPHYGRYLLIQDKSVKLQQHPAPFSIEETIYYPLCVRLPQASCNYAFELPVEDLSSNCLINFDIVVGHGDRVRRINELNSDVTIALCRLYDCSGMEYGGIMENYAQIEVQEVGLPILLARLERLEYSMQYPFRNGMYKYFIRDGRTVAGLQNFWGIFCFFCIVLRYQSHLAKRWYIPLCCLLAYTANFHFYLYHAVVMPLNLCLLLFMQLAE